CCRQSRILKRTTDMPRSFFLRFLLSGGLNTLITYVLYLLLMRYMPYWGAYSISFGAGILLAYVLNRVFVFRQHRGAISWLGLPLIYAIQYGAGLLLLWLWISIAGLDARLGPLAVIAATVPLTFVLTRYIFVGHRP